jgi:hypothetical protein
MERQRESEKRETDPFLPHSILPFLDFLPFVTFSCGQCQNFWVVVAPNWELKTIQDGNLEPLYACLFSPHAPNI